MDEQGYINLIRHILSNGSVKSDRTNTGVLSVFGAQVRYSLLDKFPLFTTKRVFWKAVREELLWFIQGCTDSNKLSKQGVKIWDANGSKEFLTKTGLNYKQGDLGPIYGFQWRHFGATYKDCDTDYTNQGVDQLRDLIEMIKRDPTSRRLILSSWNPKDIGAMALPPCHCLCQFYVLDGKLSCHLYQRSGDMGLGVPFNVASYALLTYMIAHVTNLVPYELVHTLGDAHVYINHIPQLMVQCSRRINSPPQLKIMRKVPDIESFKSDDFCIENYNPKSNIFMPMAV